MTELGKKNAPFQNLCALSRYSSLVSNHLLMRVCGLILICNCSLLSLKHSGKELLTAVILQTPFANPLMQMLVIVRRTVLITNARRH